jgi:hypothetical protein
LSVTAGAGNDSLVDVPTNYGTDTGVGNEVRGNYCTLNPLATGGTLSNGNLNWVQTSFAIRCAFGTIAQSTGKWYYEVTVNTQAEQANTRFGISRSTNPSAYPDGYYYIADATKQDRNAGGTTAYGATFGVGDVIGVAYDLTAGTIAFYKNGASQGTAFTTLGSYPGNYAPVCFTDGSSSISVNYDFNFGQRAFAYTAPSGFKALCDTNLPTPVVAKGSSAMDVKLYTGNGSTQTISGLGFSPDLVWTKARSFGYSHILSDTVRGVNKQLISQETSAESSNTDCITAFTSDGFTVGTNGGTGYSGTTYAAWCWDAGTSTVTNTAGSITSQVRANPSAGFSVATFNTGSSGVKTVGHGLNVAPQFFIIKSRSSAGQWAVYHSSIGADKYLLLYSTSAAITDSGQWVTSPTSSVFTFNSGYSTGTNVDYVGYFFSPVSGYSSFGSYTGNGSADGPFVFCNFRPRWVMVKKTNSASVSDWVIQDTGRDAYNPSSKRLYSNLSDAEDSGSSIDFLSNGFKIRVPGAYANINESASTYIYACFAESPFAYSRAR